MRERVAAALEAEYGLRGAIEMFPGEIDLNFDIRTSTGRYVFKVMRPGCDPAFIDMQVAGMEQARHGGLGECVPQVIRTTSGGGATVWLTDEAGAPRIGWLISFVSGTLMADIEPWTPAMAASIGATLAVLNSALADFEHDQLDRCLKWDLRQAGWIGDHLDAVDAGPRRETVARIAERFTTQLSPRLDALPRTPIHGDVNDMNVLFGGHGDPTAVSGLIDFGDMIRTPKVCEPAIAMAYAMMGPGDPLARGAALAGAFHARSPLSDEEITLLGPLVSLRLAVSATNAAVQRAETPDNAYLSISEAPAWRLLDYLAEVGEGAVEEHVRAGCAAADPATLGATKASLLARRRRVAPANQSLSYAEPLYFVRGERQFLYDQSGAEYLDAYNNVPHVGHAHPRVVEAVRAQMAQLNTNTRYLQDVHLDYAERMIARLPASLTKIVFVSSASEANELALRLARAVTGARDMIVMDHGYHGGTTGALDMSPYKFNHLRSLSARPDWVHIAPQPDVYRGRHRGEGAGAAYIHDARELIDRLIAQGRPIAGYISECLPSVGGQIVLPDGYLSAVYEMVRAAGGVCIADDVQTALGRLGAYFWGFEQQSATPDIAVMGKPLGNGYPLAAVAMTDAIADAFAQGPEYFSTFGGSSAACAAGAAVLDVLADEDLQANALAIGDDLLAGLRDLARTHDLIGDVRGYGFFLGVDLVRDRDRRQAATEAAASIKNQMRQRNILIGVEGPEDNVLKIRPPMTFDAPSAERLLATLDEVLRQDRAGRGA